MNDILSGAAMGAALTVAGVYAPDVILTQFNFTDFTMLQTFLTAAAGSSYVALKFFNSHALLALSLLSTPDMLHKPPPRNRTNNSSHT